MKVLYHLGLGDAIACAAIIAKLAQENDVVEIPCWEHNVVSVQSFYVNHPNVIIRPFKHHSDVIAWGYDAELRLGHYDVNTRGIIWGYEPGDFVQHFYRQAGFDISKKEHYCPIKMAAERFYNYGRPLGHDYILIHQDKERGFKMDDIKTRMEVIEVEKVISENYGELSILYYLALIKIANQIHCIDSSFLHLVECLPTKAKLFYHKYARPNSTDYKYLQKKWEVING